MRSILFLSSLLPLALACDNVENDACASAMNAGGGATFCLTYTQSQATATTGLPDFASACSYKAKKLSSACSCLVTSTLATVQATSTGSSNYTIKATTSVAGVVTNIAAKTSSTAKVTSTAKASSSAKTSSAKTATGTSSKAKTTAKASSSAKTSAATSSAAKTSAATSSAAAAAAQTTTAAAAAATSGSSGSGTACTVTDASGISSAVASCTNIVLQDVAMPESTTLDLTGLQDGSTVTFAGNTSFATTVDSDFNPIEISGTNILITGASGHVIDGNGPSYWDGEGSNGGTDKPDHFIVLKDMVSSTISNLNIKNWPVHCFDITGGQGITLAGLTLDNTDGDAPNSASGDLPAAHNSDGFDISSTDTLTLSNSVVKNQDDCVAVTSGSNIVISGMTCSGGHGLSIGSVGGKSNNTVSGITFKDSTVENSENGCRIKTNSDTTGTIENIVYSNIYMKNITDYGIDIQQDYLNGGATGDPTNGVTISTVTFTNVTGTTSSSAYDYYILCGSDSCSGFTFTDVSITGGGETASCNYPTTGCPGT